MVDLTDVNTFKLDGIVHRFNLDGTENPKYVDLLDEDKAVAGQKFCCVSFISPEKILADKNLFYFQNYVKQWDMAKSLEKYTHFMSFLAYKFNLNFDDLNKNLQDFCLEEKNTLFNTTLEDDFKTYLDANEERLDEQFNTEHNFKTNTRGIKVRGSYPSQKEAELRCKMLREVDPNHDVYVGPVGMWMPFHPEAYKTGRVDYLEDELNQLMNEKQKNEKTAKQEFEKRVRETKEKAMEANMQKALETGNVLTQTIDKNGNLISVKDVTTFESGLGGNVSSEGIRKELFENENVVIDYKNSDHGLSALTINAAVVADAEPSAAEPSAADTVPRT